MDLRLINNLPIIVWALKHVSVIVFMVKLVILLNFIQNDGPVWKNNLQKADIIQVISSIEHILKI
jgi:hypothetical protein